MSEPLSERAASALPRPVLAYIRGIDVLNRLIGRCAMYLIFVLIGILLWSSFSKTFFLPTLWTLETAQFVMVAYYVLGGPYSIQLGSNVRMDLFYGGWSPRQKAWFDSITVLFLMFYLGVLLYGGLGSLSYSLGYFGLQPLEFFWQLAVAFVTGGPEAAGEVLGFLERSSTAWRPYLWPIKTLLVTGVFLMLLQVLAELFRDIGRIRGMDI